MSPYRRNFIVGLTVLGGLLLLVWMILQFSGKTAALFTESRLRIVMIGARADGIDDGSPVFFRGVNVGQVTQVTALDNQMEVRIIARIVRNPVLPGNVQGIIKSTGLIGGGSSIYLELIGDAPEGTLQDGQQVRAIFAAGMLPPEFAELAVDLRETSRQFRESKLVEHLDATVQKATQTLDSLNTLIGNEELQTDVRQAVKSLRTAAESATKVSANLESFTGKLDQMSQETTDTVKQARTTIGNADMRITELSEKISARLEQISKSLDNVQSITSKIDSGQGTAGMLVNDPKLYQALVDSWRELNLTITDLKRLIEQWEQEGVTLKLK